MKLKKYPKKPKASASVATMENYLRRRKEVDKENSRIKAEAAKKASLRKKISGL
jgi:hypothetical protein